MLSNLLLVLGVAAFSAGLRSSSHPLLFRLGTLCIAATSFLAGWLLGGSVWLGAAFAISWIFLPWLEILTRVRKMRLPVERKLTPRTPPTRNTFPNFREISNEIEECGFEFVEDTGWDQEDGRQFYRVFQHATRRMQAAICLVEQREIAFFYLSITSRTAEGGIYVTWNYPFAYGLKTVPGLRMNRVSGPLPFAELVEAHAQFLRASNIPDTQLLDQSPEQVMEALQHDLEAQISHNLKAGLLRRDGEHFIRYTARGMFYLWLQFLRDLVRFS